jgi:DNA-binding beta-propeller fold protein YncE
MFIRERFEGQKTPFEGDRLLTLRSLPEGALVVKAIISLTPVKPPGGALFEERISFSGEQGEWGARKRQTGNFAEVDFHARRTLLRVAGESLNGASLQVDIGGLYVQINALGAMTTPDDGVNDFAIGAAAGGLLPSLATQKFKLELANANPRINSVDVRTTPANVSLRLGGQPSFWARPGELASAENTPDFSLILNAFLPEVEAKDGFYEIPLSLHSDALCRLDVAVEIEFTQQQAALPAGVNDVALAFDHSTLPLGEAGVISVQLPPGACVLPGQTTARLRGSFANSRVIYGPTGQFEPAGAVTISPDRAQATPLIFAENVDLSALDLLLTSISRTVELAVDLVEDLDGRPGSQSVLSAQVKLGLDSQIANKPTWINANLPVEVQIKAGIRLWLVAQSLSGEAAWSVISQAQLSAASAGGIWTDGATVAADQANGAPLGICYTDTGGLSWRAENINAVNSPLVGLIHLRQPSARYQVPIALQVGAGENATRVDLSRFEPLGRVDFHLDFAEFADAINQAAAGAIVSAVPQGEHLLNNEFEAWRRVGDAPFPRVSRVPAGSGSARGLAASPDSTLLYLVNDSGSEIGTFCLAALETACHQLKGEIALGSASFYGLAASPDGSRACVLQDDQLTWVDLEKFSLVGQTAEFSGVSGKPLFSPDGGLLYLLSTSQIGILDVGILEAEFQGDQQFERAIVGGIAIEPEGEASMEAVVHALSPDGSRLYVVVVNRETAQEAEVRVYDTAAGTLALTIGLGDAESRQYQLALNPAGTRLVMVDTSSQLVSVYETRRGQALGTISVENDRPLAVTVDPAGRLAWVACEIGGESQQGYVTYFDLARTSQGFLNPGIRTGDSPADLLILPSGERLYVADEQFDERQHAQMSSLPLGALTPEEWTLTAGRIHPVCAAEPYRRSAILGDFSCRTGLATRKVAATPTISAISQVVPVVGNIRYELTFWGLSTSSEVIAEVIWYGADCGVQQTDRLPFAAFAGDTELLKCALERLIASTEVAEVGSFILGHRLTATSPAGSQLAEVRFTAPANEAAFLDRVSLQATANALANGDLQHIENGQLVGWNLTPTGATGVTFIQEAGGLRFRNNGSRPAALEQTAAFSAQASFELAFTGLAEVSSSAPRLELQWLDASHRSLGAAISVELGGQGSNRFIRRGKSPLGTAAATLRLVVPVSGNLFIQGVTFQEVNLTSVPITVIGQAPGELNVSDMQIVYDVLPIEPPKALPAGGLCPPTPPAGSSSQHRGCCYCPNCGETDDLCDAHETETPAGQPALEGECCHCGAQVRQIGGSAPTAASITSTQHAFTAAPLTSRPGAAVVVRTSAGLAGRALGLNRPAEQFGQLVLRPAVPAMNAEVRAARLPAITEVNGVTPELSARLRSAGFGTLNRLAQATPSKIEEAIVAALGIENQQEAERLAKRISRNSRSLLSRISSTATPDGG